MNYGLPYMGSKSKLAPRLLECMPPADTFYDLFCGGCSMTHAAMLSGRYKRFVINDILPDVPQLFIDAIGGRYRNETRWISREDFFRLKDTDAYVRLCWSFGNDQRSYLYGRDVEPYKRAFHYALFFNDPEPFRELGIDLQGLEQRPFSHDKYISIKRYLEKQIKRCDLNSYERLNTLQGLSEINKGNFLEKQSDTVCLESYTRLSKLQGLMKIGGGGKTPTVSRAQLSAAEP